MNIAFDIETTDLPREVQERVCKPFVDAPFVDEPFKEFKAAKNWKPETVEAKKKEHEAEKELYSQLYLNRKAMYEAGAEERKKVWFDDQLKKAKLKAHQSQILCYSIYNEDGGYCVWADGDEKTLVRRLLHVIDQTLKMGGKVIGANVLNFDILFVWRRALVHGLRPEKLVSLNAYNGRFDIDNSIIDVLKVWQGPEYGAIAPCGLNALANLCGIEGKTEASGATFDQLAKQDKERAERYAIADSRIAYQLAIHFGCISQPVASSSLPF